LRAGQHDPTDVVIDPVLAAGFRRGRGDQPSDFGVHIGGR